MVADKKYDTMIVRLSWNYSSWKGFDIEGYKNKTKSGYWYVTNCGFGIEWWNFYDFDKDHYFGNYGGNVSTPITKFSNGLLPFISKNIIDKKQYFIGFYADAEYGEFNLPKPLLETLNDKAKDSIYSFFSPEEGNKTMSELNKNNVAVFKGSKKNSVSFLIPINFTSQEIGLKQFGRSPIVYVGDDKKITKESLIKLFLRARNVHEELLTKSEYSNKKSEIEAIIQKIEYVLKKYFSGEDIGTPPREREESKNNYYPKQLILYGPPGTGKTYNAILKAHEILFGSEERSATYKLIKEKLSSQKEDELDPSGLSWIDAIILAFDELKKDRISVNEIKKSRIIREFSSFKNNRTISNSIWHFLLFESALDSETIKVKIRGSQELFDKDTESKWFLTEKGETYLENLKEDIKSSASLSESQFSFITFHQSYSYEDFIEGIRPDISDVSVGEQISYRIKDGLFKDICKKAVRDPSKNYVLIIDEINRGNISKIFGEMITLLEENKRMGEKEEVTVRLPYSGEEFRIPPNVFIIGTMNSTDKSIALVDIALRRRFHFERRGVELSLIRNNDARKFLDLLNKIICALKNPDYEIGHSYFMIIPEDDPDNQELSKVFVTQILPLIEEYFFNDWEALATILGKDSIKIEKRKKFVWDEDNGKFEEETGDYDKIYGRCLAPPDEIFKNTKKSLKRFQSNTD